MDRGRKRGDASYGVPILVAGSKINSRYQARAYLFSLDMHDCVQVYPGEKIRVFSLCAEPVFPGSSLFALTYKSTQISPSLLSVPQQYHFIPF